MRFSLLALLVATAHGMLAGPAVPSGARFAAAVRSTPPPSMFFNFGGKKEEAGPTIGDARDADLARRQGKLDARRAKAATQPKGAVEVTFPQKGNKVVIAQQGEPIGKVVSRAGLRVKFDCKNGRCGTCQVRLNGRSAAKVCQGATVRCDPHDSHAWHAEFVFTPTVPPTADPRRRHTQAHDHAGQLIGS